jgi:ankyrin repeat protein
MRVTWTLLLCFIVAAVLPVAHAGASHQSARAGDVGYFSSGDFDVRELNEREPGSGQTPLMAASLAGQHLVVRALLKLGADPSVGEKDGYTPPHGVAFQGRPEAAAVLIEHSIRVDEAHEDGYTPLHRTVWGGQSNHIETAKVLLEGGNADPDALDAKGFTAGHVAAERKWDEMVMTLLRLGADPNLQTKQNGDTLLHTAVKSQRPKMVAAVLLAGGDASVKNAHEKTARDLAEQMPSEEVRALLSSHAGEGATKEDSNAPNEL